MINMCRPLWEVFLNRDIKRNHVYEIIFIHWEYYMVNVQCVQEVTLSKIMCGSRPCLLSFCVFCIYFRIKKVNKGCFSPPCPATGAAKSVP